MSPLLAVLVALGLAAASWSAWVRLRGQSTGGAAAQAVWQVLLLSLLWLLVNQPVEGPTLWVVTRDHGLTVADLLVVPPLAVAAVLALRQLSQP